MRDRETRSDGARTAASVLAPVLGAAVSSALAWSAVGALAQDEPRSTTGRETGFVAVTGPAQESVPGGVLVVAAYALALGLLLGYVARLGWLQARTERDLERLERAVEGTGAARATSSPRAGGEQEAGR
jgi:hypothetical protein